MSPWSGELDLREGADDVVPGREDLVGIKARPARLMNAKD